MNSKYSFFATCYDDQDLIIGSISSILTQTIIPSSIIIVDSGSSSLLSAHIADLMPIYPAIKFIHIHRKLPRVQALNLAISFVEHPFCFRFDSRSRFCPTYVEVLLPLLTSNAHQIVGAVPTTVPGNSSLQAYLCSEIMHRAYIFGSPRHRRSNYIGKTSSVYLGGFNSSTLKQIKYRESPYIFSEDSVLSADFISRSYIPCIGNTRVDYLCRSTISSIVHLFVSYGECRANAFIYQRSTYGIGRYMFFLSLFVLILSTLVALSLSPLQIIFSLVLVLFLYNLLSELFYCRSILTIHFPFLALLCQFSWIFGFACATLRAFYPFRSVPSFPTNFFR